MANYRVVFTGKDTNNHVNVCVTDGTSAGTSEVAVFGASTSGLFYGGRSPSFARFGHRELFAGYDVNGHVNLWVTNGTTPGTSELTPGEGYYGIFNFSRTPDFTIFGNKVLFAGVDASDHPNLWVTDGTSAGTNELVVAGVSSNGLDPDDFTVLGSKALFSGVDTSGHRGLWATDGRAAGTSELTVGGANPSGLFDSNGSPLSPDFTVVGDKVVFDGIDVNGSANLWVTDGTSAGTSQLTFYRGFWPLFQGGLNPHFTLLGSKLLFEGWDSSGRLNPWITDGTSAGTSELTVARAHAKGLLYYDNALFSSLTQNPDFTVLGNRVLFQGEDASADISLWVTDGTGTGTSELTVAGANSDGLFHHGSVYVAPDITVLGSKALFAGFDSNGHINLWVTDGTSGGTSELTVSGADPSGLFYNNGAAALDPDFTVVGNKVLFAGYDVNGHVNLWVTDGTAAGTSELTATGAYSGGLSPSDFTVFSPLPVSSDFNGDGDSDFIYQNSSGEAYITWYNGGGSLGNPGLSWHIVSSGDFNN